MTVIQISQNENKLPDLVQRVSQGERIVLVNGIEKVKLFPGVYRSQRNKRADWPTFAPAS